METSDTSPVHELRAMYRAPWRWSNTKFRVLDFLKLFERQLLDCVLFELLKLLKRFSSMKRKTKSKTNQDGRNFVSVALDFVQYDVSLVNTSSNVEQA